MNIPAKWVPNPYFGMHEKGLDFYPVFGFCDNIGVAELEDIWPPGGRMLYFNNNRQVLVQSSDAADNAIGQGAQRLRVWYLDQDYTAKTLTVIPDGGNLVPVAADIMRIYRAEVEEAGDDGTGRKRNFGNLIFSDQITTEIMAIIPASFNSSLMTQYTVPAGFTGFIYSCWNEAGMVNDDMRGILCARPPNGVFNIIWPTFVYRNNNLFPQLYARIEEKWDVCFKAQNANTGNAEISAGYQIMLVPNDRVAGIAAG